MSSPVNVTVRVGLLQRMTDARLSSAELCSGADGNWANNTCWLGDGWKHAWSYGRHGRAMMSTQRCLKGTKALNGESHERRLRQRKTQERSSTLP